MLNNFTKIAFISFIIICNNSSAMDRAVNQDIPLVDQAANNPEHPNQANQQITTYRLDLESLNQLDRIAYRRIGQTCFGCCFGLTAFSMITLVMIRLWFANFHS